MERRQIFAVATTMSDGVVAPEPVEVETVHVDVTEPAVPAAPAPPAPPAPAPATPALVALPPAESAAPVTTAGRGRRDRAPRRRSSDRPTRAHLADGRHGGRGDRWQAEALATALLLAGPGAPEVEAAADAWAGAGLAVEIGGDLTIHDTMEAWLCGTTSCGGTWPAREAWWPGLCWPPRCCWGWCCPRGCWGSARPRHGCWRYTAGSRGCRWCSPACTSAGCCSTTTSRSRGSTWSSRSPRPTCSARSTWSRPARMRRTRWSSASPRWPA